MKSCGFILLSPISISLCFFTTSLQNRWSLAPDNDTSLSLGRMMMAQSPINSMADNGWKHQIRSLLLTRLCKSVRGSGGRVGGGFHCFIWKLFNLNVQHSHVSHFESHHKYPPCSPVILPSGEKALIFFTCNTKLLSYMMDLQWKPLLWDSRDIDVIPDLDLHLEAKMQPTIETDPGGITRLPSGCCTSLRAGQAPEQLVFL